MIKTVYLIRPWNKLRFHGYFVEFSSFSELIERIPSPIRAFPTQEAAERYAIENPPLTLNPFLNCRVDDEEDELEISLTGESESESRFYTVSLQELLARCTSLGIAPPDLEAEEIDTGSVLYDWWNANTSRLTEDQKRAVWRFVVPEPYQIIPVELEIEE
jgi:hypothetical protein